MKEGEKRTGVKMPPEISNVFLSAIRKIVESEECTDDIRKDCLALTMDIGDIKDDVLSVSSEGSGRALGNISMLLMQLAKEDK